ncbi:MAG: HNH endonuclease [Clostridiales bacterium]|nr:HNH endonuclease [Clostridiales bacterium]
MKEKRCPSCAPIRKAEKAEHNRKYDTQVRDKTSVNFYHSSAWRKLRQHVLIRDNYLCQECLKESHITSAEIVHHIIEIKDDPSLSLKADNCISLCKACHNKVDHKYRSN